MSTPPAADIGPATLPADHAWRRLPAIGGIVALVGLAGSIVLGLGNPRQFYFSWLVAFLFALSLALGALFFVLTHFVTGAKWSVVVRRAAEHTMGTLPLFALLFVPLLLGLGELYHWTAAEHGTHDPLLEGKRAYLNLPFFLVRAFLVLAAWSALAGWFARVSRRQDQSGDPNLTRQLIRVSAPALFVFAITVTIAAVDWIMSLEPHWFSTMFGVYYFAGAVVGFFAFFVLLTTAMRNAGLLPREVVTIEHIHDLGKLLFAFTVFWAYIAFSQFFLIWYANLPEETFWYIRRAEGGWSVVTAMLAWGHFIVPFFFLMSQAIKRRPALLVAGAAWVLAMHLVDIYWLVMPNLHPTLTVSLLDFTTLLAVGGAFVAAVGWRMRRGALVPIRDPRLPASMAFENV